MRVLDLAERTRSILASKGLTLNQLSRRSATLYGRDSRFFVPHNLYHDFQSRASSPSLYQFMALSRISGYSLPDWLRVFGFQLEDIPRLQVRLPAKRTALIDGSIDDPNSWIPWLDNRAGSNSVPPVAPLGALIKFTHARRLRSLSGITDHGCFYVKIGQEDALGFPELLPGSIVRANPRLGNYLVAAKNSGTTRQLFLIQHSKGLFCCRLRVGDTFIIPVSRQLSYAQVELQVPNQVRILGIIDLEIRPALSDTTPQVPKQLGRHWEPTSLRSQSRIGELLSFTRSKMKLSLRDASALSRRVAEALGDDRYFISQSSLCDYEVADASPRHIHKAISLCILYGLRFWELVKASGLAPEQSGTEPIPDYLIPRSPPASLQSSLENAHPYLGGFLGHMLSQCGEIPLFLRQSMEAISSLPHATLDALFWTGGDQKPLHPNLVNALVVLVDRRKKRPVHFRSKPLWQQPIYLLQKRDGSYLCGCCSIENGSLVLHPYSSHLYRHIKLRYHDDAEVIGQVVTIARKLL
jgi:hypothetical protein